MKIYNDYCVFEMIRMSLYTEVINHYHASLVPVEILTVKMHMFKYPMGTPDACFSGFFGSQ